MPDLWDLMRLRQIHQFQIHKTYQNQVHQILEKISVNKDANWRLDMSIIELQGARAEIERKLRQYTGKAIFLAELDVFALACGCNGITANVRGLSVDDVDVFKDVFVSYFAGVCEKLDVKSTFLFARLIPATNEVAALNARNLCEKCYVELVGEKGVVKPRPDMFVLHFKKK